MADPNRPSFLRGLAGRIGDRLVWGNNYNRQTGQFTATPSQIIGGLGSRALNFILPGAGTAANVAGNAYYGAGPLGGVVDRFRHNPQELTRQPMDFQAGVQIPGMPLQMGAPNFSIPSGFMPSPYGPYAGGYQFAPGMTPGVEPSINEISGLPNTQSGYGVSLPNYGQMTQPGPRPMQFSNATAGMGGPFKSTYMNDPWGDTAASFGVGIGAPGSAMNLGLPSSYRNPHLE